MPLVNSYLKSPSEIANEPKFPLIILFCNDCALSQLSLVVSPEVLFRDYDYYSSVSKTFQSHCAQLAKSAATYQGFAPSDLVVEIASNDGCLLSEFKKVGARVKGVEPARNLAKVAESRGLPTISEFWSAEVAKEILASDGPAKIVVCTNVLAHVDDLHGFLGAVRSVLAQGGRFIFEVPYMAEFLNRRAFDTTYHEHLSYFLATPLKRALEMNGLTVTDIEKLDIHGGSIRVTAQPASDDLLRVNERVTQILNAEIASGLLESSTYLHFQSQILSLREELSLFVKGVKARGHRIAAYGASAKGNVLLNFCGLNKDDIDFVVDDTPAKQNKLYPGVHIPIVARSELKNRNPKYLLLLAWNFTEELMANTKDFSDSGGRYVVPIPGLHVLAPSILEIKAPHEKADCLSSSV